MNKNYKILLISLTVLLVIFIFLPITYPINLNVRGKLLPHKTWVLAKETDGRIITSLDDNAKGISNGFTVTQFERGDAIQFKFNLDVVSKQMVYRGDTIGYVISNEIEKDIEKLKGELESSRASLNVQTSSEKESVIEEEKSRLKFAEKELEEQTKVFERKSKLIERNLISQQEFDADEARFELAKINVNIAKERLRSATSGAKQSEVDFAAAQINALENEIRVLQKRYENNNIVSPINGLISRSYARDTLLVISDIDKNVVLIPVKWSDLYKVKEEQKVVITRSDVDEVITGSVKAIGNNVQTNNTMQYVLVTVISDERTEELKPGLYVDCKIECGDVTAVELILDFIKPYF